MTQNMYIPFTYHIAWTKHNLHYYGVRYAQGTTPADLWTKYHTSSDKVKELKESLGEPDIIEIRKEFKRQEEAKDWEHRVLKRLGVTKRDDWINESCWPACDNRGRKLSEETKNKMSVAKQQMTEETKKKISESLRGNIPWNKGRRGVYSDNQIKKMSESQRGNKNCLGYKHSTGTRKNMSEAQKGKTVSEETKKKISDAITEWWKKRK